MSEAECQIWLRSQLYTITVLHWMQGGQVARKVSVHRLTVCQTREIWQNGRKICPDFYTIRKTIFATPSAWNFGSNRPRWREIADFEPIFARNSSAV